MCFRRLQARNDFAAPPNRDDFAAFFHFADEIETTLLELGNRNVHNAILNGHFTDSIARMRGNVEQLYSFNILNSSTVSCSEPVPSAVEG
jgi:hypothetical protein